MFILERLLGVTTYTIVLLFIILLISVSRTKKFNMILFLYAIALSIMAYFYKPSPGADLYRINLIMDSWRAIDLSQFINIAFKSSTPIAQLYIYGISKLGNNNLLPAITALIYYSNIFYIFKKSAQRYSIRKYTKIIILFFLMSTGVFIGLISGIRNHLAFSIIAVCIFREVIEEKHLIIHLPFYVLAALMHNAAFVLVIIRFSYLLIQKSQKISTKILFMIIGSISVFAILVYGQYYIAEVIKKAMNYIGRGKWGDPWGYLINITLVLNIILMQKKFKKVLKNQTQFSETELVKLNNVYNLSKIISLLCIVFVFEYNIFARFSSVLLIISIPWILYLCENEIFLKRRINIYGNMKTRIILVSIFLLMIAGSRGELSALKFFIFD